MIWKWKKLKNKQYRGKAPCFTFPKYSIVYSRQAVQTLEIRIRTAGFFEDSESSLERLIFTADELETIYAVEEEKYLEKMKMSSFFRNYFVH